MKKPLLFLFSFIFLFTNAQRITFNYLKNLSVIDFQNVKSYVENSWGFQFVPESSSEWKYVFFSNKKDFDDTVMLQVLRGPNDQNKRSVILLNLGKNINLEWFKAELIENGFKYNGEKNMDNVILDAYIGDSFIISITKPDDLLKNVRQIMVIPKEY